MNQRAEWNLHLLQKLNNLSPDSCELEEPEVWLCQISRIWTANHSRESAPRPPIITQKPKNIICLCVNHTDPCMISPLINSRLKNVCQRTACGLSRHHYHYHLCGFSPLSRSLRLSPSSKTSMLGGFDLLSPFKDCWPVTCKTLGDLALGTGIGECPAAPKQSHHITLAGGERQNKQGLKMEGDQDILINQVKAGY